MLDRLGVDAGTACYVGDGSSDELLGAKHVGFSLIVLAAEAPTKYAPDDLPRLHGQADEAIVSLSKLGGFIC